MSGGLKKNKTRKKIKQRKTNKKDKKILNKTLKASNRKIAKFLKKKNFDNGNISVHFASITPNQYFTKKEIENINN